MINEEIQKMSDIGLKFEETKKIQFGDLKVLPVMNQELELRVKACDFSTIEGQNRGREVLAECFGEENREAVLDFMKKHLRPINLSVLQAYLLGGEQAVDMVIKNAVAMGANNE